MGSREGRCSGRLGSSRNRRRGGDNLDHRFWRRLPPPPSHGRVCSDAALSLIHPERRLRGTQSRARCARCRNCACEAQRGGRCGRGSVRRFVAALSGLPSEPVGRDLLGLVRRQRREPHHRESCAPPRGEYQPGPGGEPSRNGNRDPGRVCSRGTDSLLSRELAWRHAWRFGDVSGASFGSHCRVGYDRGRRVRFASGMFDLQGADSHHRLSTRTHGRACRSVLRSLDDLARWVG